MKILWGDHPTLDGETPFTAQEGWPPKGSVTDWLTDWLTQLHPGAALVASTGFLRLYGWSSNGFFGVALIFTDFALPAWGPQRHFCYPEEEIAGICRSLTWMEGTQKWLGPNLLVFSWGLFHHFCQQVCDTPWVFGRWHRFWCMIIVLDQRSSISL